MADWLVKIGDQEYRAQSIEEVKQWYREGRVTDTTYVFHPVQQRWMLPREIDELRGIAGSAAAAPPPAAVQGGKKGLFRPMTCLIGCGGLLVLFIIIAAITGIWDSKKNAEEATGKEQQTAGARERAIASSLRRTR